jgi:hypothetical protein
VCTEHRTPLTIALHRVTLCVRVYALQVKSNRHDASTGRGHGRASAAFSGALLPEAVRDVVSRNASWLSVAQVLARGLGAPRATNDWWDYYMRLGRV